MDIPGHPGSGERGQSDMVTSLSSGPARTPEHQQGFSLCHFVLSHPPPKDPQVRFKWLVFTECTPEGALGSVAYTAASLPHTPVR